MSKREAGLRSTDYWGETPRQVLEWRLSAYCDEIEKHGRDIAALEVQIEAIKALVPPLARKRDKMAEALRLVMQESAEPVKESNND